MHLVQIPEPETVDRPLHWIPRRAGVATNFEQLALTGGLGLCGEPPHLDFAIGRLGLGNGDGFITTLAVSFLPGRN